MPPGWYPDPYSSGLLRWWDGAAWTAQTAPTAAPSRDSPVADLATEHRRGARARVSLVLGAVAYSATLYLLAATQHDRFHRLSDRSEQVGVTYSAADWAGFAMNLSSLALLIVFMAWLHSAATLARRSGLYARRSPGWAYGAWFVPIVGLWFPYQLAVDCFHGGDPRRRIAGRWWAAFIAQTVFAVAVVIGAAVNSGTAVLLATLGTITAALTAVLGRSLITTAGQAHDELVRSLRVGQ